MLYTLMNTKSQKYSLVMTGAFLLTLISQNILVAPHTPADLFASLSGAAAILTGVSFYFLGVFLFASVLLSYQKPAVTWLYLATVIAFFVIGWVFFHAGYLVEGFIVLALALAFFLCNWLHPKFDWLVETMLWANLVIGAGLLLRPALFMSSPVYNQFPPSARLVFGIILMLTSFAGLLISLLPALVGVRTGRILALPWIFWGLLFVIPTYFANLFLSISIVLGLMIGEYIPWEKLVLVQAAELGRRFLRLLIGAQIIFLGLVLWMITLMETGLPGQSEKILEIRLAVLICYNALTLLGVMVMVSVNLSINGLFSGLNRLSPGLPRELNQKQGLFQRIADALLAPFDRSQNLLREYIVARQEFESLLVRQMAAEKRRMAQLNLLHQLNLELESVLDPPVSAQLTANAIFNALGGTLVIIWRYDHKGDDLVAIATSGPQSGSVPAGYRQITSRGLVGRAARLRRAQLASDTRLDPDYFKLETQAALSEMVVPLLQHNRLKGLILVDAQEANVFDDSDIRTIETVAVQLVTSWERSDHDERLTSLIGAGITLSTTLDVEGEIKEIAQIALATLDARFVFVALKDQGGGLTRTAYEGHAPTLLSILNSNPGGNSLIQDVINSDSALRMRDVRKRYTSTLTGGHELRSLLAVPIRVRQSSIGAILAFGKMGNISFSENDESLVSLLASQAAAAIESTWLYQKLRTMLSTATQLSSLGIRIIQSEQLTDAAAAIAETAYKLSKGDSAGIVLTALGNDAEIRVQIDGEGLHPGAHHPMELIGQSLESEQTIIFSGPNQTAQVSIPLQTPMRKYGALWVQVPEQYWSDARYSENLHTLANQAAIALERSLLIMKTRKQAIEIETAYHELEITYDLTLGALSSALDARDRETEGHSLRVARIAYRLGLRIGLTLEQAKTLERGSILHDIGKIGISDSILLKPGPLSEQEWQIMREHPDIGARIIGGIPFLQEALPVIRFHQERWDGSGYPIGLKGHEIPIMARIFAIVDAFDALTNDRPYRKHGSVSESMAFLREKTGILFDPVLVAEFERMSEDGELASLA